MSAPMLVSVVTPCRNSAHFLEACIASVIRQDYPYVEHVIQDGASTDGSLEILSRYDGKVEWISEPDLGQSDGLNRALHRCRGDVIGVLNADDEYLPGAAAWAVEQLLRYPDVAVVYGDQFNVDAYGRVLSVSRGPHPYRFDRLFCVEDVPLAQAAFIRRSHFEQVGLHADVSRRICPDYEMWVRIGLRFPMRYVPGVVAKYRVHARSESQQCDMVDLAVRSRVEVIDRTVSAAATPQQIKRLRGRAVAGAYLWAAVAKRDLRCGWLSVLRCMRDAWRAHRATRTASRIGYILGLSAVPVQLRSRVGSFAGR